MRQNISAQSTVQESSYEGSRIDQLRDDSTLQGNVSAHASSYAEPRDVAPASPAEVGPPNVHPTRAVSHPFVTLLCR